MNNNKLLNNDEYLHTYLNMIACTKNKYSPLYPSPFVHFENFHQVNVIFFMIYYFSWMI